LLVVVKRPDLSGTEGSEMGLGEAKVEPAVPVSDVAKAKEFYEGKLGLSGGRDINDGGITYPCGGGREFHIYPSPDNAGKSGGTIAAWEVDDLEKTVDELTANGVGFEQVDSDRVKTNEKGIAELGDDRMAWFKDPDGNVHGVVQL
jgi:catechol 2,3-dioxygenase-like lactoylglutathione lyase family enzyme